LFIDNKGKLFGKINLVDAVVLLFIVLAVLGACYRFFYANKIMQTTVSEMATYKVTLTGVRQVSADTLNVGDKLFLEPSNQFMGTLIDKIVVPNKNNIAKTNGEVVEAVVPGRFDVKMTIEIETGTEPVLAANIKNKLIVGNNMYLKTRQLLFGVMVEYVDIEKLQ